MQYKVLIVEDDPMVSMINEKYVSRNKNFCVVGTARNGQEALAYLEENQVDLIVLDVYMPYMDGIETLKAIRERKINSEVIMVTAANDTTTLEQTMHLGVIDYLIKPFALERFEVALEKFSAKAASLKNASVVDQSFIDRLISSPVKDRDGEKDVSLPKGIQPKTLQLVLDYLKQCKGWQSGDMIADKLGLSIVTVRHYLSYLVESSQAKQDIDYETGGRPCMLYKID